MIRWFRFGLIAITVVALATVYLAVRRAQVPEACQAADRALEAEDYNGAIDHYLACLDSGELPTEVEALAHFGLGLASSAKGDHDQAIRDYSEVVRLVPDSAWAYNNRCWSYGLMHRPGEALRDCDEALRLLPDQPAILDSRALAHWLLNDKDKAREDLERARRLDPSSPTWDDRFRDFDQMF